MTSHTLYVLYNADASVMGKLRYGYRKITCPKNAESECAACDITHGGLSLKETPPWVEAKKEIESLSDAKVVQLHRDELSPSPLRAPLLNQGSDVEQDEVVQPERSLQQRNNEEVSGGLAPRFPASPAVSNYTGDGDQRVDDEISKQVQKAAQIGLLVAVAGESAVQAVQAAIGGPEEEAWAPVAYASEKAGDEASEESNVSNEAADSVKILEITEAQRGV
ncbi:hypothetical protein DL764_010571 [Monosporascus ibericus]|uniref:Uncharacterized protein n=1 Tax=Monosporascus ibericus TaxID=155417 RepID=A0A4Q4SSJ5_9PEZI|nr:hypothetical protein DL764_010571 [Monosporascus ibericus]